MGNYESVQLEPEVSAILNREIEAATIELLIITLTLKHELFLNDYNLSTHVINLFISDGKLGIGLDMYELGDNIASRTWIPRTKMHDFEVIDPFTPREIRIAKGAGICVIILDSIETYIKLAYNESKKNGIEIISGKWNHSSEAVDLLKADLYVGYHVLFVADKDFSKAYEMKHKRETKSHEGKVWIPSLDKNLENYAH